MRRPGATGFRFAFETRLARRPRRQGWREQSRKIGDFYSVLRSDPVDVRTRPKVVHNAVAAALLGVGLATVAAPPASAYELPATAPLDGASVRFGDIWCPAQHNGGSDFRRITRYEDLPNDPVGDGLNNCYQAAFDTSVFSTDGKPLRGCENFDPTHFPGQPCQEIRTPEDFRTSPHRRSGVNLLMNDIEVTKKSWPQGMGAAIELTYIGLYDEATMRPVSLRGKGVSSIFNWNSRAKPGSGFTLINARMSAAGMCVQGTPVGGPENQHTVTLVSVTGRCSGRFAFAGYEELKGIAAEDIVVDDRWYMKNVLARGGRSHSIYLDRTHVNWVEDSLIIGPFGNRKHALKLIGRNVVVRNTLVSNEGVHGEPVDYPELRGSMNSPPHGIGGLAPIDMMTCGRSLIDGVTTVAHYVVGYANNASVQWQKRKTCNNPILHWPPDRPLEPYYGPLHYNGIKWDKSPAWGDAFWEATGHFDSFVLRSNITKRYDGQDPQRVRGQGGQVALMSRGTYPAQRISSIEWLAAEQVPAGWFERTRIHVSGNCLDNGHRPHKEAWTGQQKGLDYPEAANSVFRLYGDNACASPEPVDADVEAMAKRYEASLPPPPWINW